VFGQADFIHPPDPPPDGGGKNSHPNRRGNLCGRLGRLFKLLIFGGWTAATQASGRGIAGRLWLHFGPSAAGSIRTAGHQITSRLRVALFVFSRILPKQAFFGLNFSKILVLTPWICWRK